MQPEDRLEFHNEVKNLPSEISIVQHVHERITELKKLYNDIAMTKKEKLIHQMLPNHMRRRAMSHNPKRLPLKYRQIHINQMAKSGPTAKKRRPSRKYRRKSRNLMLEYERRKKASGVWLETHIWHAKRYHMKELWGYKIPLRSTDKRYRASYRAAANHCLLQDISYIAAIELTGPLEQLKVKLDAITSRDAGLSFTAKCHLNGTRAGRVELFKANRYPFDAICSVDFLWRHDDCAADSRTLWIFVHPVTYQEVLEEFVSLFELRNTRNLECSEIKLMTCKDASVRNPKYVNQTSKVSLVELKSTLNRFRLTGPFSNAVLRKALKPSEVDSKSWLSELFESNATAQQAHTKQLELWCRFKLTKSPTEIPPHSILNINVIDPRTNRPSRRVISKNDDLMSNSDDKIVDVHSTVSTSPIWSKELRDRITNDMISTGELCKLRNKQQLVPGIAASFEKDLQPVPILLVQRPGSARNRLSFGSGFDIIVPAGYGMSVWLSLIQCGAKSGGWREMETVASEMCREIFQPDSIACSKEELRKSIVLRDEYFRKPPNKRTNYHKMSIASPFLCPWKQLVSEWGGRENFYVIRNRAKLAELYNVLKMKTCLYDVELSDNAIISINLTMVGRGSSTENGIICLPSKRDVKTFLLKKSQRDKGPIHFEPEVKDVDENTRKLMRINHKKLLKRLRNRRVRMKKKLQAVSEYRVKIPKSSTEKLINEQYEKICELWLPRKPSTIRKQCSRQVIGYVTSSRFNFTEGKVCSLGFLASNGFAELIKTFAKFKGLQPFVLTRASNSKCYNVTNLSINEIA